MKIAHKALLLCGFFIENQTKLFNAKLLEKIKQGSVLSFSLGREIIDLLIIKAKPWANGSFKKGISPFLHF